jgi:hypothetical protein
MRVEKYFNRDSLLFNRVVIFFLVFLLISFLVKGRGQDDYIVMIFGSTTFVFGVLLAFYISTFNSRFDAVISELQTQNGAMLYVYYAASVYGKEKAGKILGYIDTYLISQLEYFLYDFSKTNKAFLSLFNYVLALDITNEKEKEVYGKMIDQMDEAVKSRKLIESKVRSQMSKFEWVSLIALLVVILLCLFFLNTNTFFASIVVSLLATASVMLLLILHDLETFAWKEQTSIWEPIGREFEELGLLPFYPRGVIIDKRIIPRKGKIRIATYPHPYPDISDKIIEITEVVR